MSEYQNSISEEVGEKLAFEQAAKLCREYSMEIKHLRSLVVALSCGILMLISYIMILLGVF